MRVGCLFYFLEEHEMLCNDFECVYEVDGECEPLGTECTGDMCEEYGSA